MQLVADSWQMLWDKLTVFPFDEAEGCETFLKRWPGTMARFHFHSRIAAYRHHPFRLSDVTKNIITTITYWEFHAHFSIEFKAKANSWFQSHTIKSFEQYFIVSLQIWQTIIITSTGKAPVLLGGCQWSGIQSCCIWVNPIGESQTMTNFCMWTCPNLSVIFSEPDGHHFIEQQRIFSPIKYFHIKTLMIFTLNWTSFSVGPG